MPIIPPPQQHNMQDVTQKPRNYVISHAPQTHTTQPTYLPSLPTYTSRLSLPSQHPSTQKKAYTPSSLVERHRRVDRVWLSSPPEATTSSLTYYKKNYNLIGVFLIPGVWRRGGSFLVI